MSIRIVILLLLVAALAVYAWRDWFISLCGLIVLTALMGHPDMPRQVLGISGLNPWNLLLAAIVVPWWLERRRSERRFDLPRSGKLLLSFFLLVVLVAYARAAFDLNSFPDDAEEGPGVMTFGRLTNDYLLNSVKYLIPGLMLFDGCRTRRRTVQALIATLLMAVVYAALVCRTVPVSSLQETGRTEMRQRHRIGKKIGFHANSVAMICASGAWGIAALGALRKRRWHWAPILGAALLVVIGLILTRSRGGYVGFVGVGILFAVFLWRRLLILLPASVLCVGIAFPGVTQRVFAGVGVEDVSGDPAHDLDAITAGRSTDIWPPVVEQIEGSPLIGYGRLAILRTPAHDEVKQRMNAERCPTHPHNAYLEILLDSGVAGAVPMLLLYGALFVMSAKLCRDRRDPLFRAVGGASLAAVAVLLLMGMSGQTFFPKENSQMAWCLYGIAARVWTERPKPGLMSVGAGSAGRSG